MLSPLLRRLLIALVVVLLLAGGLWWATRPKPIGVVVREIELGTVESTLANTRAGTVIGFVHFFVMLLTLTIFANLKQLSPNYRKAAADLGAGPVQAFVHVILPLTLPGIMVGAFLTFVLAIGDYITPQTALQ